MKVKELKHGAWFTKKQIDYPNENQVWIRLEYDRESKKYICQCFGDIGKSCLLSGDKEVYTDFTF